MRYRKVHQDILDICNHLRIKGPRIGSAGILRAARKKGRDVRCRQGCSGGGPEGALGQDSG